MPKQKIQEPVNLSEYGPDLAENINGTPPGSSPPATCAGCFRKPIQIQLQTLADGRVYWVCQHCGYPHESEHTQGTANGLSAYANPFVAGDFVHEPGNWNVYRVLEAYQSRTRGEGYFSAVCCTKGSKPQYSRLGRTVFENAMRWIKVDDPAAYSVGKSEFYPNQQVDEPK